MTEKLVFGLVGCGAAGKIQAQAMHESQYCDLRWIIDNEPRAAQALAERFHAQWSTELDRVLDDAAVTAISLAVPHYLHAPLARRAAQAGKHILLEKPFTLSTADATALVAHCIDCGVKLVPWLERRYLPYVDCVKEILASGSLGKIVYTRVCVLGYKPRAYWEYGMRFEEYPSAWRSRKAESGGGILLMNGIHQIDLMSYLTGLKASEVFANVATLHHEVEVEDIAVVNVRYRTGALGVIEASCCTYGVNQFPIEAPPDAIMGTDGYLQLGTPLKSFDRIRFARQFDFPKLSVTDMKIRQLEDFHRYVTAGTPMRCTSADIITALAVIEAAYKSAAARGAVELEAASGAAS